MALLDAILANAHKPLFIAALVLPTTRAQRILAFGLIVLAELYTFQLLLKQPPGNGFTDYSMPAGVAGAILLSADVLLMNANPRVAPKRVCRAPTTDPVSGTPSVRRVETSGADMPLGRRVLWAIRTSFDSRCIGTTSQVAHILPLSPSLLSSRTRFCLHRVYYGLTGALRLGGLYLLATRLTVVREAAIATQPSVLQRVIATALGLPATYLLLNTMHIAACIVAVLVRMSEPEDWPDEFGHFGDAYTLRRAWG